MMRIRLIIFIFLIKTTASYAQSEKEVFAANEMTWYGLDFSLAKFMGDFDHISYANNVQVHQLRDKYFNTWNNVIVNERDKYELPVFFKKSIVSVDLSEVEAINSQVDPDSMMLWGSGKPLMFSQVEKAVKRYKMNDKGGLGLVFLIESFDKTNERGTMHVTFFDRSTGNILFTKRMQGKPGGIGLRNYWIKSVWNVMNQSGKNWSKWQMETIK